jgi:hypothetical protein
MRPIDNAYTCRGSQRAKEKCQQLMGEGPCPFSIAVDSRNERLWNGHLWGEADVRGAILEYAAVGKTIAAKRGSRGALELWPTIEEGTNRPLSTLSPFTIV